MRVALVNVATSSDYTEATTLRLVGGRRVVWQVANAAVYYQLDESPDGKGDWTQERFLVPTVASFDRACSGLRFRSAVAAAPAQLSAELLDELDTGGGADSFAPFSGRVTPDGETGELMSLFTGIVIWRASNSERAGIVACDGARYNSVADPSFANLFADIGIQYGGTGATDFAVPDIRRRAVVGVGPTDAGGDSDGLALAARPDGLQHRHSVTDPGHAHGLERGTGNQVPDNFRSVDVQLLEQDAADLAANGEYVKTNVTGVSVGPAGTPLDGPAHIYLYPFIVK